MSLINEALKRTSDVQQQTPPPTGGTPMKPAEPNSPPAGRGAKNVLFIVVFCVILGNALLFLALKDGGAARRSTAETATPSPARAASAPAGAESSPAVPPVSPAPKQQPAPLTPSVSGAPAAAAAVSAPAPVGASNAGTNAVVTESPAPARPATAKPAPLKLQSIIYNPTRPSAMVNGKFLFIGDRVQGYRVTAINQETVTLLGDGQTNVLSLP
jgi:hypothetical protein